MATATTEEAMALLSRTRREFIDRARGIADELIQEHLVTNGREVLDRMSRGGLLEAEVPDFWAGAIFRDTSRYRWTGLWGLPRSETPMTIHGWRPVRLWTGISTVLPVGFRRTMACPHCRGKLIVPTAMVLDV